MNFTRSQVYNSKKEDVEKLKRNFEEGGYNSLSDYFKELIMLGYDAKNCNCKPYPVIGALYRCQQIGGSKLI